MPNPAPVSLSPDEQRSTLRAMVSEIGSEPQQDPHFDYWHYEGQLEIWGIQQRYDQAVIRKFVELKCGDSEAMTGPMDLFMAACAPA